MSSNVDVGGWRRPWAQHAAALGAFVATAVACTAVMVHAFQSESVGQFFVKVPESVVRGVVEDVQHPIQLLAPAAHHSAPKPKHHTVATHVAAVTHSTAPATTASVHTPTVTGHHVARHHDAWLGHGADHGGFGGFSGFGHDGWFGSGQPARTLGRVTTASFGWSGYGFHGQHAQDQGHGHSWWGEGDQGSWGSFGSFGEGHQGGQHGVHADAVTSRSTVTRAATKTSWPTRTGWAKKMSWAKKTSWAKKMSWGRVARMTHHDAAWLRHLSWHASWWHGHHHH